LTVTNNPSRLLAESSGRPFELLEVSYAAVDEFMENLDPSRFDRLLLMGVHGRTNRCRLELLGRNWNGKTPDVRGYVPQRRKIDRNAPLRLESTLWTGDLADRKVVRATRLLTHSDHAGSYLCNFTLFRALQRFTDKKVGFLHVPSEANMALDLQQKALEFILKQIEMDSPQTKSG